MRIGIVANRPGLMDRRGREIAARLGHLGDFDVIAAPPPREVIRRGRRWDAVYVIDPGRFGLPAAVLARALGKPTFVEIGDPQADLYRAEGRSRVAVHAGRTADWLVTHHASGVVFRGTQLASVLSPSVPSAYIPDGVDLELFQPQSGAQVRKAVGIPEDSLVVGLVGSLNWSTPRQSGYGLDVICALAHISDLPIWALIVGQGPGIEHLRRTSATLGVAGRTVLTGEVPHPAVPGLLCAMDVCVSTQSNDAIGRGRTTAKLPEYLACDRFVLATPVGTAAAILPAKMLMQHGESGDPGHHRRLAMRLRGVWDRRQELRASGGTRRLAESHFGYDSIARRFEAFLGSVLGW